MEIDCESMVADIYAHHKRINAGDVNRTHLGASIIGDECARKVFYSFRWAADLSFSGRMLRLFERGRREEPVLIEELNAIGFKVQAFDEDGEQFRFKEFGGHFAGSADGVLTDRNGDLQLLEFKTSGKTQFNALVKHGLRTHKPQHYAQMQIYMKYLRIKSDGVELPPIRSGVYIVVCKDTDRIHAQVVPYDETIADELTVRAWDLVFASSPPPKISPNPAFYLCKMCHYADTCHGSKMMKPSCRTCKFARPINDGTWFCDEHQETIDKPKQIAGCAQRQPMDESQ